MFIKPLFRVALFSFWAAPLLIAQADLSHRQSEVTVRVVNMAGDPVSGASVAVDMINPTFRIGTAITVDEINPASANYNATAVAQAQRYFNSMTFGNFMKWTYVENRTPAESLSGVNQVKALKAFDGSDAMRLRGHATIWGAQYQLPANFLALTEPAQIHDRIIAHVENYHTIFKGAGIDGFDLYNEPFHERTTFRDELLGPNPSMAAFGGEVATWFQQARVTDPDAQLFINEYNMLNFWQENDADIIAYKSLVDAIRDAGGPVGGIGLQGHMDRFITKSQIKRRLDILAAPMAPTANYPDGLPGLPIEITELDINTQQWSGATPAQQAEVTANVLDGAFEHPAVTGVTIWGMNDSSHWRDNAIMFDDSDPDNWVIKPSGQALIDRSKGTWWTDINGSTNGSGEYAGTVFKGTHRITVSVNGNTAQQVKALTEDGTILVEIDDRPLDTSGSYLSNLSVRAPVAESETLKLGFVVVDGAKDILVRAAGPILADFGVSTAMADPRFEIRQGTTLLTQNDDWSTSIAPVAATLGAFAFTEGSADAGLVINLQNPTTAEITGATAGTVLGEVYDVAAGPMGPRLANVSALHFVGSGDDILIAGFVVGGTGHGRYLIRGVGQELNTQFGITDVLSDPQIKVFDSAQNEIAANDNWDASLAPAMAELGAFSLTAGNRDAALVLQVQAGNAFTVQLSGADGGTGKAIVEVYEYR